MRRVNTLLFGLYVDDYITYAYGELARLDRVAAVSPVGGAAARVKDLHTARKANSLVRLPFQDKWCVSELGALTRSGVSLDAVDTIIFLECKEARNVGYLTYLHGRFPKAKFCLVLLNPVDGYVSRWLGEVCRFYDVVVTCNGEDAKAHRFAYYPDCYSAEGVQDVPEVDVTTDVCFIAADKGRSSKAREVYEHLTAAGMTCDFVIVGDAGGFSSEPGFQRRRSPMPYAEYLRHAHAARCLLELTYGGRNYCTLRTMEAVTLGKVLLTDNASISREPFFDSDQMVCFEDVGDIDPASLRARFGRPRPRDIFSPRGLLAFVDGLSGAQGGR